MQGNPGVSTLATRKAACWGAHGKTAVSMIESIEGVPDHE